MTKAERLASAILSRSKLVILAMAVVIGVTAAGVPMVETVSSLDQFQSDTQEADALSYVQENFTGEEETTTAQIVIRGENVLSQESLVATLNYQLTLRDSDLVGPTLVDEERAFVGVANIIATTLYRQSTGEPDEAFDDQNDTLPPVSMQAAMEGPSLETQRTTLEQASPEAIEEAITVVLGDASQERPMESGLALMPTDYFPASTEADATILLVTQHREADVTIEEFAAQSTIDAQLEMQTLGEDVEDLEFLVFGSGILAHEIDGSMMDSLLIVGPLALLFVLLALVLAYRDVLDIALGLLGIILVLLMTVGFMGWTGIVFGQVFVAVPVLLIGLSIDFAIHVFMRHREERAETANLRSAMGISLAGVGVALVLVTATTAIGFLSNVVSPVAPIREFGIVSAFGIVAALLVFGALVPALKVELDELLEARGISRQKRAFGTGGGTLGKILAGGEIAARRIPILVLVVVLVVGVAGAVGGSQVDTSFDQRDFLADDPPEWMQNLPGPFATDSYMAKSTLDVITERFVQEGESVDILIRGDVTDPDVLTRIDDAQRVAAEKPTTQLLPGGEAAIDDPLTLMRIVSLENESFAQQFDAADTTGDGVPDRELEAVYDELFAVTPDRAGQYIHRTADGEYRALRMVVGVRGGAADGDVTDEMRAVAASIDGNSIQATATGTTILNFIVQEQLLQTVVESLAITLGIVFLFLMGVYRFTDESALLGIVTLLPVALAAAWILGSMYLLGIPFNVLTGTILSLTIGLGVAYSIHVSERYTLELHRQGEVWPAMRTAVTGTGGALLGSAATTVGGFGVLVFAILPPLQQFGIITGLSISYAFLASVIVLPTLLRLWTRYAGPEWARKKLDEDEREAESKDNTGDRPDTSLRDSEDRQDES